MIVTEQNIHKWLTVDEGNPSDVLQSIKQEELTAEEVDHEHGNDDDNEDHDHSFDSMLSTVWFYIERVFQFLDKRPGDISNSN